MKCNPKSETSYGCSVNCLKFSLKKNKIIWIKYFKNCISVFAAISIFFSKLQNCAYVVDIDHVQFLSRFQSVFLLWFSLSVDVWFQLITINQCKLKVVQLGYYHAKCPALPIF